MNKKIYCTQYKNVFSEKHCQSKNNNTFNYISKSRLIKINRM